MLIMSSNRYSGSFLTTFPLYTKTSKSKLGKKSVQLGLQLTALTDLLLYDFMYCKQS